MSDVQATKDRARLRRALDAAAARYDDVAVLQREVGERLLERLQLIRQRPGRVLDLGARTGLLSRRLLAHYPGARVDIMDLSAVMLRRAARRAPLWRRLRPVCADATALPYAGDSFDMVFSNLALHRFPDLPPVLREVQRVLRPGGVLMFSMFGPDTLGELRQAWGEADGYRHVDPFVDLHDVGDALVAASLADPVMDMEMFTLTYPDADALVGDLRRLGESVVVGDGRARGLTGRTAWARMRAGYERHRDRSGRLPATWEIVYGHAWGTSVTPQRSGEPGVTQVPVEGLKIPHRR